MWRCFGTITISISSIKGIKIVFNFHIHSISYAAIPSFLNIQMPWKEFHVLLVSDSKIAFLNTHQVHGVRAGEECHVMSDVSERIYRHVNPFKCHIMSLEFFNFNSSTSLPNVKCNDKHYTIPFVDLWMWAVNSIEFLMSTQGKESIGLCSLNLCETFSIADFFPCESFMDVWK